jgi:hypothetical protein
MDYKKYSLENLENWLNDAMSSGEATPQEIYDTIRKTVQEEYYYHKDKASKTNELLALLNGHRSVSFINENNSTDSWTKEDVLRQRDYYGPIKNNSTLTTNNIVDFTNLGATDTITFTSCDADDTSPECKSSWNSFWNDQYQTPFVSEDGDLFSHNDRGVKVDGYSVNGESHSKYWYEYDRNDPNRKNPFTSTEDKITKWVLPVELDGLTGDCVVTLPDDLLERVGWVEGDTVEFVSNTNGSFTVKKVVKSVVENI